jgi:hypothetical protein
MRFVVDKVELGQVVSKNYVFPRQFSFHRMLHTHLRSGAGTTGPPLADVPSGLFWHQPKEGHLSWWPDILFSSKVSCCVNKILNGMQYSPIFISAITFRSYTHFVSGTWVRITCSFACALRWGVIVQSRAAMATLFTRFKLSGYISWAVNWKFARIL